MPLHLECSGNLVPVRKATQQPRCFSFQAFRDNRLPVSVKVLPFALSSVLYSLLICYSIGSVSTCASVIISLLSPLRPRWGTAVKSPLDFCLSFANPPSMRTASMFSATSTSLCLHVSRYSSRWDLQCIWSHFSAHFWVQRCFVATDRLLGVKTEGELWPHWL